MLTVILKGTTNFYNFMSHFVSVTLTGDRKNDTKQTLLTFSFLHFPKLNGMKFDVVLKLFKLNIEDDITLEWDLCRSVR